jgi:hypothetical protein
MKKKNLVVFDNELLQETTLPSFHAKKFDSFEVDEGIH